MTDITDTDEWPADEEGVYVGECPQCHQTRPLRDMPDPYIVEINPDQPNPPHPVCYPCFHERCMDV